jgi:hypothetical protein
MSNPQHVVTDLAELTQRVPAAAADVLRAWTSTVAAVGDASGRQASSLRRLTRGMFDLADQAIVVERELAAFLTANARVSAATLDALRKLTDATATVLEETARPLAWMR